jgi:hypothetical protein
MKLFKKALEEDFIIIAVSANYTMNVENNRVMVSLIELCSPSYWELLNPDGYLIYFRSNKSNSHKNANKLLSCIEQLILTEERFAEFKVGINEGQVITEIDWRGRITFAPMGVAINVAYNNQKGRRELHN